MIVTQAENLFDVHCDGCGECQTYSGVYNKSQLAIAIQADGWVYKYTEDKVKFRHYCRNCVIKHKESNEREIRRKLMEDLEAIANPLNRAFRSEGLFYDPGYWENVINQALDIIKKEEYL